MIEWRDEALVLGSRQHGETSVILDVLTRDHGRHLGVVRGGISRKQVANLQPGMAVDVVWKARIEDHMGAFTVEPIRSRAGAVLGDPLALAGLNAICALMIATLAEREPHPQLYRRTQALVDGLGQDRMWPQAYLQWEVLVLDETGFGLDLSRCAVTGSRDDLAFVSPRTGRAVSSEAAGAWADRLLPLPLCLLGQAPQDYAEITLGLGTTGHFMERLLADLGRDMPAARARLIDMFERAKGL